MCYSARGPAAGIGTPPRALVSSSVSRSRAYVMNLSSRIEFIVGLTMLTLLALGCLVVLRPFMSAILWALILSFSTWPVYTWMLRKFDGRQTVAATVMTLLVAAVLVLPLALLGATLAEHVTGVVQVVRLLVDEGLPEPPDWVMDLPLVGASLSAYWLTLAHNHDPFPNPVDPSVPQAPHWLRKSGPN